MAERKEYYAFISYKREDVKWAIWLQRKLEHYKLPSSISRRNDLPKQLRPIFRDTTELVPGNLPAQIQTALENSRYLIVVCSPRAAASSWVNKEIEQFIQLGRTEEIIPFIIDGKVHADTSAEECFPPALRALEGEKEILGANINELGRDAAAVKVIAKMFGLKYDSLWNRYQRDKKRRRFFLFALITTALILSVSIAFYISRINSQLKESNWNLLRNESLILSEKATQLAEEGDGYTATRLALEALPSTIANPSRPYTVEADAALRNALAAHAMIRDPHSIISVSVSPDGKYIVSTSSSEDCPVTVWDFYSGKPLFSSIDAYELSFSAAFTPDGKRLVTACSVIQLWDTNSLEQPIKVIELESDVEYIAVCSSGSSFAVASEDGSIFLFDALSGEMLKRLPTQGKTVQSLALTKADGYLVSGSEKSVCLWNLQESQISRTLFPTSSMVNCVAIDPKGEYFAAGLWDNTVKVWSVLTGQELYRFRVDEEDEKIGPVMGIAFSPDGKLLAAASERRVTTRVLESGFNVFTAASHELSSLAFCPDGRHIVTGSSDNLIRIWNVFPAYLMDILTDGEGVAPNQVQGCQAVAFHPNGKILVAGIGTKILQWDIPSKQLINIFEGHSDTVSSVCFCNNGDWLVSCADDNTVRIWDTYSGVELIEPIFCERVSHVAGTIDASRIAAVTLNGVVSVYDVLNGKPDLLYQEDGVSPATSVGFSSDGNRLVIGTDDGGFIRDLESKEATYLLLAEYGWYMVSAVAFSPDGKTVVTDEVLWDAQSGEELYRVSEISSRILSVAFSPDGRFFATTDRGGCISVWDVNSGHLMITLSKQGEAVNSVAFSPDGSSIATAQADNTIRLWSFPDIQSLIDTASDHFEMGER